MSQDNKCMNCKHFIFKIMLNGYGGYCELDYKNKRLRDCCEENFQYGKNEIYQRGTEEVENDKNGR